MRGKAVRMYIVIVLPYYYISWEVVRMLWPANPLNLNIIEPYWFYIKLEITKKGAIYSDEEFQHRWIIRKSFPNRGFRPGLRG